MHKEGKTIVVLDQASGYLQLDMLHAFKEKYEKRVIIAGSIVERSRKLDDDIQWHETITYNRSNTVIRIFTWLVATIQMWWIVRTRYRKTHLFIVTNPPTAVFIPLAFSNSFDLLIYDIYPDILIRNNYLSPNSMIAKMWRKLNRKVYPKARQVFTISKNMKSAIGKYVDADKVKVVPIWSDNAYLKPIEKEKNVFLNELNLQDKFIISYSGNFGESHNIEALISLAERMKDDPFYFLLIGGGAKFAMIKKMAAEKQLNNVSILPWQPVEKIKYTFNASDIAVVTLGDDSANMSVPSKTYDLMSVAKPIMVIADPDSELGQLIREKKVGEIFRGGEIDAMENFIRTCYNDRELLKSYSTNAYKASKEFTSKNAYEFI